MVDDIDNHVVEVAVKERPWELPLLLVGAFRSFIDDSHALLAEWGHPHMRPVYGFALQAIGSGATATEVGQRLGVSKQAAGKTLDLLGQRGYVTAVIDPTDKRRKLVRRTALGDDLLDKSVTAFAAVTSAWADRVGVDRIDELTQVLSALGVATSARVDLGSWMS